MKKRMAPRCATNMELRCVLFPVHEINVPLILTVDVQEIHIQAGNIPLRIGHRFVLRITTHD